MRRSIIRFFLFYFSCFSSRTFFMNLQSHASNLRVYSKLTNIPLAVLDMDSGQAELMRPDSVVQWLEHWSCKPGVKTSNLFGGYSMINFVKYR